MFRDGIKIIAIRANGFIPLTFEIEKKNGLKFYVCPTYETLKVQDELKNQLLAIWANLMAQDLGLPVRFFLTDGDMLQWEPRDTKWAPMTGGDK